MNLTLPGGIFTILLIDLLNGDSRTPIRGTGDAVAFFAIIIWLASLRVSYNGYYATFPR